MPVHVTVADLPAWRPRPTRAAWRHISPRRRVLLC